MQFISSLAALLVGAYAWAPSFAVDGGEPPAVATPTPPAAITPALIMQLKMQDVCARSDSDLDGYISRIEFVTLRRPGSVFKASDADHDGRLSLHECEKALASS